MEKEKRVNLIIGNRIEELERLNSKLDELKQQWNLPPAVVTAVNLALEEAVANVIFYAYENTEPHEIEILFVKDDEKLITTVSDSGKPYDPTIKEDPDINLPASQRPVGGLGIFLIKKIMNSVEYRREDGCNKLTLIKILNE